MDGRALADGSAMVVAHSLGDGGPGSLAGHHATWEIKQLRWERPAGDRVSGRRPDSSRAQRAAHYACLSLVPQAFTREAYASGGRTAHAALITSSTPHTAAHTWRS